MKNFIRVLKKFPSTFWVANTMELFERWAWYGFYMLFANYLTKSTDIGALGFSQEQKSAIMSIGTSLLYLLPLFTGAIADRFGYKKTLSLSFLIYIAGFVLMPHLSDYNAVFLAFLFLAIGGAFFKPVISATVAKTTDDETSSIGFGIFYMMVNIGAFIGPMVALQFKGIEAYRNVFYMSAVFIAINFLLMLIYKEPDRGETKESLGKSMLSILRNIKLVLSDYKFVIFLIFIAGFWSMYYQLFLMLPVFVDQWVDLNVLFQFLQENAPWLARIVDSGNGTMKAEYITNVDALYIILFQLVVSTFIMKWKPLNSMMTGFLVCTIGMALTVFTANVYFILGSILVFGLGEMAGSPKITEYIGKIAPKDKTALYIGMSYLPVALGSLIAGYISGTVYGKMSDKLGILKQEVAKRGFTIPEISKEFTQTDFYNQSAEMLNMNQTEMTRFLWENYHPNQIWVVLFGVGVISVLGLLFYDRILLREKKTV